MRVKSIHGIGWNGKRKLVPAPTKIYGGKFYLCSKHLSLLPPGIENFYDLFGGTGVVALNVPDSIATYYNDIDWMKVNVLRCIQSKLDELLSVLNPLEYSWTVFKEHKDKANELAAGAAPDTDNFEPIVSAAVSYIVRNRMSRGACEIDFGWSDRLRRGMPEYISAWKTIVDQLPKISKRLQGMSINWSDAMVAIKDWELLDNPANFLYLDPPYMAETRVSKRRYGTNEMSDEQHKALLAVIATQCRAKIAICGYFTKTYTDILLGWRRVDFTQAKHSGQGKKKKITIDSIWLNY